MKRWFAVAGGLLLAAACAGLPAADQGVGSLKVIGAPSDADVPGLLRFTTAKSIQLKGKRLPYTVELNEMVLRSPAGEAQATATTFTYLRSDAPDAGKRPVIFLYNGGPGSASLWQHIGFFGPRRLKLADAVHPPITPPFELEDNPHTLLDIADIVCIDPVGTGYSRLLKADAAKDYYGVDPDAVEIASVMEDWLTRHQRWNSPKFILGESYGATRSAVLARNLLGGPLSPMGRMMGISLNGVIILGPALSADNRPPAGVLTLPSAAAAAWYHKRAGQGETLDAFMARVKVFVHDEYAPALGDPALAPERKTAIAEKVAAFTGLPRDLIEKANLQPSLEAVRANLLKDKGLRLGSYDARYTLPLSDKIGTPDPVADDPAMGQYSPAFVAGMQLYVNELGLNIARKYDAIAFDAVNFKWDNTPAGRGPKTPFQSLAAAMNRSGSLGLFVGTGWYDFVTNAGAADNMVAALGLEPGRDTVRNYPAGHMPYLGEESATQLEADLRAFIAAHTR